MPFTVNLPIILPELFVVLVPELLGMDCKEVVLILELTVLVVVLVLVWLAQVPEVALAYREQEPPVTIFMVTDRKVLS
mgnify:CR=1 FL=1